MMRYKAVKLSRGLWYVQNQFTKRFYFERYTDETIALKVAKTLEEKREIASDFVLRPHLCSTIGEQPDELVVVNAEGTFWYIEHEETGTFMIHKFADFDEAERSRQHLLKYWNDDPHAKARTMGEGYFVSSPSFVKERPLCS